MSKFLSTSKNRILRNSIINNISDHVKNYNINNYNNAAIIGDMWGVSWLYGYAGVDLFEILDDIPYEGGEFDGLIERLEDSRDSYENAEMKSYYNHDIKNIEQNCFPGDVCVVDKNGDYRPITRDEIKKLFKSFRDNVKKSHFTIDDYKRFYKNKSDLMALVG